MLTRLLAEGSTVSQLKAALDESMGVVRGIAHRVANASAGTSAEFAQALERARQGASADEKVDLEQEMVALANEQLRFEATSRLLEKVYNQIRSSVRER